MRRPVRRLLVAAAVLSLGATACGGTADEPDPAGADGGSSGPSVVATTTILGDIVRRVAQSDAQVQVLMPPGQDPHGFAPSARQAAQLRDADLVVANGLQLEESLLDTIEAAEEEGVEVLRVADQLDPLAFEEDAEEHAEHAGEGEHDHGPEDPHVWHDPVRMADGARLVAEHLAEVDDTLSDDAWASRGEAVAEEILAAHAEVEQVLAEVPEECRLLVTNHDSLGYLAARYDLEVIGTVVPGTSTQAEPSAREFADLAELLRETAVPAIFAENVQSTGLADSLAAEVGREVEVVELFTDSLGEPGSGAETYTDLLVTNARRIADALASC